MFQYQSQFTPSTGAFAFADRGGNLTFGVKSSPPTSMSSTAAAALGLVGGSLSAYQRTAAMSQGISYATNQLAMGSVYQAGQASQAAASATASKSITSLGKMLTILANSIGYGTTGAQYGSNATSSNNNNLAQWTAPSQAQVQAQPAYGGGSGSLRVIL